MQASTLKDRPTGVVVLAVLQFLGALSTLGIGIAFVSSGFVTGFGSNYASIIDFGYVMIVLGLLGFLAAWGLWSAKRWAWALTIALTVLGILISIFGIGIALASITFGGVTITTGPIVGIFVALFILYYLTRSEVRAYFRKSGLGP